MTSRTDSADRADRLARQRVAAYAAAIRRTTDNLAGAGASRLEIATGALDAALEMLADMSDRDQVRRMLHELADSLIGPRV